jgi:hypothetical protein
MDWVFEYPLMPNAPNASDEEVIRSIGALLAGRRCYEVGGMEERPETSGLYGGLWTGPEFILTHRPPEDGQDSATTFLSGDIREDVFTALAAAKGKDLLVLGANVVDSVSMRACWTRSEYTSRPSFWARVSASSAPQSAPGQARDDQRHAGWAGNRPPPHGDQVRVATHSRTFILLA